MELTLLITPWQATDFCNQFYRSYFLTIEQEIFAVLTDTFHKPGFKLHVAVLQHLFCLVLFLSYFWLQFCWNYVHQGCNCTCSGRFRFTNWTIVVIVRFQVDSGSLTEPLWDASTVAYPYSSNAMFVREYTIKLLGSSFPNMTVAEVRAYQM